MRAVLIAFLVSWASGIVAQVPPPQTKHNAFGNLRVVQLHDGPNQVDLNGDGKPDLVFLAWRDNANAHGFDVFTFYLANLPQTPMPRSWLLVPLYDSTSDKTTEFYRTFMGADCVLSDIRLLRPPSQPKTPIELVTADREFGETFVDSMPVTFTVFRFVADSAAVPGWPPYYFQASRAIHSRGKYCDVNDAFLKELGLGPYRDLQ